MSEEKKEQSDSEGSVSGESDSGSCCSDGDRPITLEEKLKAARHYDGKRASGKIYYAKNREKCLEYTRRRRERLREERKKLISDVGEADAPKKKTKKPAEPRPKLSSEESKARTALRQKQYRLRRKQAYLALQEEEAGEEGDDDASVCPIPEDTPIRAV